MKFYIGKQLKLVGIIKITHSIGGHNPYSSAIKAQPVSIGYGVYGYTLHLIFACSEIPVVDSGIFGQDIDLVFLLRVCQCTGDMIYIHLLRGMDFQKIAIFNSEKDAVIGQSVNSSSRGSSELHDAVAVDSFVRDLFNFSRHINIYYSRNGSHIDITVPIIGKTAYGGGWKSVLVGIMCPFLSVYQDNSVIIGAYPYPALTVFKYFPSACKAPR